MIRLNLGCGGDRREGYINIDYLPKTKPDIIADLDQYLPWQDNSIDEILCINILEHLKNPVQFLIECHRILKPGAKLIFRVPLAGTFTLFNDLTHRNNFTPKTFKSRPYIEGQWKFKTKLYVTLPLIHIRLPCFFYYLNAIINNLVTGLEGELIKEQIKIGDFYQ